MSHLGCTLSIIFLATVCISACKCGQRRPPPAPTPIQAQAPVQAAAPIVNPLSEQRNWVGKIAVLYPEIFWLANPGITKTEEGHAPAGNSFSQMLFSEKFVEFDRALLSLYSLKLILDGSDKAYQEWTAAQPENVRLLKGSFNTLHEQARSLLTSNYQGLTSAQIQQAMETMLALGGIGKSENGRRKFNGLSVTATDPDEFYEQAITVLKNYPRLSRSFSRLSYLAKQLLQKTANLINCQQLLQREASPALFAKLKKSNLAATDPTALSLVLFVETCKLAGTLGDVNNTSSLAYTEQAHQAMQAIGVACRLLADPMSTELDAYNCYLSFR